MNAKQWYQRRVAITAGDFPTNFSMALSIALLVLLISSVSARPDIFQANKHPSMYINSFIIGGEDAAPGEFPWQLSLERLGSSWSHNCGASLLSPKYGLTAAHCVFGVSARNLRVKAGLHKRNDSTNVQISNIASFKIHERYELDNGTFSNDIAILVFTNPIVYTDNVQPARIPSNNDNLFTDQTCTISGWGRTSDSYSLPNTLQKADLLVLEKDACQAVLKKVKGANIWDGHICVFDSKFSSGSCNADSGGPLNCNMGSEDAIVTGVTSWGIESFGTCLISYPSVYTRIGYYVDWIKTNTP